MDRSIAMAGLSAEFEESDPRFQLIAVVAQYAEVLRESYWAKDAGTTLDDVSRDADRVVRALQGDEEVQEFAQLAWEAVDLSPTQ